jgi:hypothetical protein
MRSLQLMAWKACKSLCSNQWVVLLLHSRPSFYSTDRTGEKGEEDEGEEGDSKSFGFFLDRNTVGHTPACQASFRPGT